MAQKTVSLATAEALPKDVGRGHPPGSTPRTCRPWASRSGDVVRVKGKRAAFVKVMPTFPDHRGKKLVQLDGLGP